MRRITFRLIVKAQLNQARSELGKRKGKARVKTSVNIIQLWKITARAKIICKQERREDCFIEYRVDKTKQQYN